MPENKAVFTVSDLIQDQPSEVMDCCGGDPVSRCSVVVAFFVAFVASLTHQQHSRSPDEDRDPRRSPRYPAQSFRACIGST